MGALCNKGCAKKMRIVVSEMRSLLCNIETALCDIRSTLKDLEGTMRCGSCYKIWKLEWYIKF